MPRIGLDRDRIISAAVHLVEEAGYERFSMHALAAALGVKTASLYNHIDGLSEVYTAIGHAAVERFRVVITEAAGAAADHHEAADLHAATGLHDAPDPRNTLLRIAMAMRAQAKQTPALYRVVMDLPMIQGGELKAIGLDIIHPMIEVLRPLARDEQHLLHLTRAFRSMMHGFISFEASGYFVHPDAAADESYRQMIDAFARGLVEKIAT